MTNWIECQVVDASPPGDVGTFAVHLIAESGESLSVGLFSVSPGTSPEDGARSLFPDMIGGLPVRMVATEG